MVAVIMVGALFDNETWNTEDGAFFSYAKHGRLVKSFFCVCVCVWIWCDGVIEKDIFLW